MEQFLSGNKGASLAIKSYAKINLCLEVLYKREDEFHQIRTVMQELELHDLVMLEEVPGKIEILCDNLDLPLGEGNLAYDACQLMQRHFAPSKGVRIKLAKNIPVAAGLGGGSSNAAAVLKGLNVLWSLGLGCDTLCSLAASLGSDVPFFVFGGTALAEGRGEIVTPLSPLPKYEVLLVLPDHIALSAGEVYRALNKPCPEEAGAVPGLVKLLRGTAADPLHLEQHLPYFLVNDLEEAVFLLSPETQAIKEKLQNMGFHVLVSGSGPALFVLSSDREALLEAKELFLAEGHRAFLTETKRVE